ncbi:MAG: four helix bundle protein [Rhodopirellula sp.]|nr:four helix bundle protein [Rhodopirellula sp.]
MKKHEELVVITKTYDLILWSCNHTGRFPRQHRFVLGERLERSLYDLLDTLIQAKYSRERTPLLNDANLKLEILRFQIRLAKDLNRTSSRRSQQLLRVCQIRRRSAETIFR